MELKGCFIPQFQVSLPRITHVLGRRTTHHRIFCVVKVSSSFGETFPMLHRRWRTMEIHSSDNHNIHLSSLSGSTNSRPPELAFDRLQLPDQELSGDEKRVFGRFVARGAVLDEEYWTAAWLRAEAHWESLSYMRHVDNYKRKYAEQNQINKFMGELAGYEGPSAEII